ncbi:hypothetical protein C8F01DRAFT_563758 [Mycena amicta]|nr:hypothetical protein C8F01DRAFT_563758 [Mycena amicta]
MPALSFPPALSSPAPTVSATSLDADGYRTLVQLLRSCVFTILLYNYSSIYPNVPKTRRDEEDLSFFKTPWRWVCRCYSHFYPKLVMLLVALVFPESIFNLAFRQHARVKELVRKYDLSKAHAWLLVMGGFASSIGTPIVSESELTPDVLDAICSHNVADLKDRSKSDLLSDIFTLVQLLWFILQLAMRVFSHLPVAVLEIATVAYALMPLSTWGLWKDKPKDVVEAIRLPPPKEKVSCRKVRYIASILDERHMLTDVTSRLGGCAAEILL